MSGVGSDLISRDEVKDKKEMFAEYVLIIMIMYEVSSIYNT